MSLLRECVNQDEQCRRRFKQAKDLAESLYRMEDHRRLMPFYTDHGPGHCLRVEKIVSDIIFGDAPELRTLQENAFVPTPEEAAYLLSAIWLHDIGMIYGILPGETSKGEDIDWECYRDQHELRSAAYIRTQWQWFREEWADHERIQLGEICIYHRQRHPLGVMSPAQATGKDGPIRLRELAALLRLADACHVDHSRTPPDLKNLFQALGMPVEALEHWAMPARIHEVFFDGANKTIQLACFVPKTKRYGFAIIDFQLAVDRLVEGIQVELDSVAPYLASFSNTAYETVSALVSRPEALGEPEGFLRDIWPCMLRGVSSASEVACTLAAILIAQVCDKSSLPKKGLSKVMQEANRVHPYNFLVRRLVVDMHRFLKRDALPKEVEKYLGGYIDQRVAACNGTAEAARRLIDPNDVLVVYGYSHEVMTLLTKHLGHHPGQILVVKCYRHDPHLPIEIGKEKDKENDRIMKELAEAHLNCSLVEMASLRGIFSHLQKKKIRARVLMGGRGIFNGGDILCTTGNAVIADVAKASGIDVFVLLEPDKELPDQGTKREMERVLEEQAARLISRGYPGEAEYAEMAAPIDRLTRDMYTERISADGPTTKEQAVS